jgi:hypothetical protein
MSPQAAMLPTPSAHADRPPHTSPGHRPSTPSCHQLCPSAIAHHHTTDTVLPPTRMPPTLPRHQNCGRDADAMTHAVPTTPTDAVATLSPHPYQRGTGLSPSPHPRRPTVPMGLPHPRRPTAPACRWSGHTIAVATPPSGSRHDTVLTPSKRRLHAVAMPSPIPLSKPPPHCLRTI